MKIDETGGEHTSQVPVGIENCETVTDWGVKHYGFVDWEKNVAKYKRKMERDAYDPKTGKGGSAFYDRMVNEEGLTTEEYHGENAGDGR